MPMYKLTPTFTSDFDVSPKNIVYSVNSYHKSADGQGKMVETQETDPRKALELKQLELIERLKAQTESLNKLLIGFGKSSGKPEKIEKSQKPDPKKTENPEGAQKLDKNAKKEARKAAKAEAVKKVASGEAPPTNKDRQWSVEDDRKTWETNLSLTVNLPANLVNYPTEDVGEISILITEKDRKWAELLAKIGEKRGIQFCGEVKNGVKTAGTTKVKVGRGSAVSATIGKTTVKSLETIWKILGSALGLYSRKSQQVLAAAHQSEWLGKAASILHSSGDLSFSVREASQFLARFDSLSSQWEISMADVVFRSLLMNSEGVQSLPNNVEIWAKKIDSLLV